jgi:hypothetical protein
VKLQSCFQLHFFLLSEHWLLAVYTTVLLLQILAFSSGSQDCFHLFFIQLEVQAADTLFAAPVVNESLLLRT